MDRGIRNANPSNASECESEANVLASRRGAGIAEVTVIEEQPKAENSAVSAPLREAFLCIDFRRKAREASQRQEIYFLRWRILARMRRFLRPCLRRPLPDFFVPNSFSSLYLSDENYLPLFNGVVTLMSLL